ncbi:hypothetical protein ACFYW8_32975 [Streptomyces sp. NPDC002742]
MGHDSVTRPSVTPGKCTRQAFLDCLDEKWRDMRPKGLADTMGDANS